MWWPLDIWSTMENHPSSRPSSGSIISNKRGVLKGKLHQLHLETHPKPRHSPGQLHSPPSQIEIIWDYKPGFSGVG